MTLKAYFDTIKEKTGKTPEDFKVLAEKKGFLKPGVKAGEIVTWLKEDYGLGRGHAMALVLVLKQANSPKQTTNSRIDKLFAGSKSRWRKTYDGLLEKITRFGSDVTVSPTDSYIGILRKGRKFAIVQVISDRFNIGIKLKGVPSNGRLGEAGTWNAMVTHRVRIEDPTQIDAEVISWLRQAYDKVY
jgi:hypothetical protein